ncbi:hypothetical protein EXIGLDRAFT_759455 [Exidia glandulosa HHB12029]|uniref:C3H1-type domain-containing protein n=1 Tax=Exidia glandulosa HHB12029 TaxID=1314781 RepID=A0A165PVX7_EXIGL|nr:hypothetical protein EXIGLDRAFT_759455 [Exidia glandulosa HHB12029]
MSFSADQTKEIGDIVAKGVAGIEQQLTDLLAKLAVSTPGASQGSSAAPSSSSVPPPPGSATQITSPPPPAAAQSGVVNLWATPDAIADAFANQAGAPAAAVQHSPAFFPGASPSGAAATSNPLAGKNVILRFPHVEQSVLLSVLAHTIEFKQLVKLNPRFTQQTAPDQTLQLSNGQLSVVDKAVTKSFPDMNALLGSLLVYFDVLSFSLSASHGKQAGGWEHGWTLSHGASLFVQHLLQLQQSYTFVSVLQYAERFFQFRRAEMLHSHYAGWWAPDNSLMFYLHPLPPVTAVKASGSSPASQSGPNKLSGSKPRNETICTNFVKGTCTGDTCPWGRKHALPAPVVQPAKA